MHSRSMTLFTVAALALATGCSTLKTQRSRLDGVQTAAVIAYSADVDLNNGRNNQAGNGGVIGMVNAATAISDMSSGEMQREREDQAVGTYESLLANITQGTGWKLIQREQITAHPRYMAAFETYKSNFSGLTGTMGSIRQVPKLLMHHIGVALTEAERQEIMDGLKVDAVIVVRVRFVRGGSTGFSIGGIGKTGVLPKAIVDLTAWDRQGGEPIWRDSWAEGEAGSTGIETTMGVVDDDQLTQGMEEAAQLAYQVLMDRYRTGG